MADRQRGPHVKYEIAIRVDGSGEAACPRRELSVGQGSLVETAGLFLLGVDLHQPRAELERELLGTAARTLTRSRAGRVCETAGPPHRADHDIPRWASRRRTRARDGRVRDQRILTAAPDATRDGPVDVDPAVETRTAATCIRAG